MNASLVNLFYSLTNRAVPPSLLSCFKYRTNKRRRLVPDPRTIMGDEAEKPRVTELLVRMDCNGCVQRIKKALHNIEGVYEVYTDIAQQKLTVVGRADPERIVKAIKRTRKIATICSHIIPAEPAPPANEEVPSGEAPAVEQPPPPAEEPLPVNPPVEQEARLEMNNMPPQVRMMNEYPHNYGHRDYGSSIPNYYGMRQYENNYNGYANATHSYNNYRPSPYVSEYHGYTQPSLLENQYAAPVPVYGNSEYYPRRERTDGQITAAFSDENPNACTIV